MVPPRRLGLFRTPYGSGVGGVPVLLSSGFVNVGVTGGVVCGAGFEHGEYEVAAMSAPATPVVDEAPLT